MISRGGGGVGDEVEPVSFGVGHHVRLYQYIDVVYKGVGVECLERFNEVFFSVRRLVLVEERSGGGRLHWC